jgi:hypothetical protein
LVWHGKYSLEHLTRKALTGKIYSYTPFQILKELVYKKMPSRKAVDLLSSESYLVTIETFNAMRANKNRIKRYSGFSKEEIQNYVQIENSNCEDKKDRKICLFGLLTGFSPKLSRKQTRLLSRYNLFVQYLNRHSEIAINKTRFFPKTPVPETYSFKNFAKEFEQDFVRVLREYYLYQTSHAPQFFLQEKRRELLFMYFVRGCGLMEGPFHQSQQVRNFLLSIDPKFLSSATLLKTTVRKLNYAIPAPRMNYVLFRCFRKLAERHNRKNSSATYIP